MTNKKHYVRLQKLENDDGGIRVVIRIPASLVTTEPLKSHEYNIFDVSRPIAQRWRETHRCTEDDKCKAEWDNAINDKDDYVCPYWWLYTPMFFRDEFNYVIETLLKAHYEEGVPLEDCIVEMDL